MSAAPSTLLLLSVAADLLDEAACLGIAGDPRHWSARNQARQVLSAAIDAVQNERPPRKRRGANSQTGRFSSGYCPWSPTKAHVRRLAGDACLYCEHPLPLSAPTCVSPVR